MLCADWDSLLFVKLLLLLIFDAEYLSKLFSFVKRKLLLLTVVRERTLSFVFKDVLSLSGLINLVEIDGVVVTAFCSETETAEDTIFGDEAVAIEAFESVTHGSVEFLVLSDDNMGAVVDTTDCTVDFDVTGFDVMLQTKLKII